MSIVEDSGSFDCAPPGGFCAFDTATVGLHRIEQVRREQGVSIRTCARRLGLEVEEIRLQEHPDTDLRLSQLRRWQQVLGVPLIDLLEEPEGDLSRPILDRAKLVRLMKTALGIRDQADSPAQQRLAQTLIDQLLEWMPELGEVAPWPSVGKRRTLDEPSAADDRQVSEAILRNYL